ncbi:hypothetical protein OIU78_027487 [Salix suchowensis]|nr:hypothetical protein OIU78_027487 [Salix suchowensis]
MREPISAPQLKRAVLAPPTWRFLVGEGAKRTLTCCLSVAVVAETEKSLLAGEKERDFVVVKRR